MLGALNLKLLYEVILEILLCVFFNLCMKCGLHQNFFYINPRAFFVHFAAHIFNLLANDHAKSSLEVTYLFAIYSKSTCFFSAFASRWQEFSISIFLAFSFPVMLHQETIHKKSYIVTVNKIKSIT